MPQTASVQHPFSGRRLALFYPLPDLATNPCLVAGLTALRREGMCIDLLTARNDLYPGHGGLGDERPFPFAWPLWVGTIQQTLRRWRQCLAGGKTRRRLARHAYDLVIAVNPDGLVRAAAYRRQRPGPLVYFSFELLFRDELPNRTFRRLKTLETAASQAADLVVIQDPKRMQLLAAENHLAPERFALLPVAPSALPRAARSEALRRRLGVAAHQTLVLHAGSFSAFTYADELLQDVSRWPPDAVLVVHGRKHPGPQDIHLRRLQRLKAANVVYSGQPMAAEDYETLIASADIGLALYKPNPRSPYEQRNIAEIGLSSGKFAFSMKYGLPVVSIRQPTYRALLADYPFGLDLDAIDELPAAIGALQNDLERHRAAARRLFDDRLAFERNWPAVRARLAELLT